MSSVHTRNRRHRPPEPSVMQRSWLGILLSRRIRHRRRARTELGSLSPHLKRDIGL